MLQLIVVLSGFAAQALWMMLSKVRDSTMNVVSLTSSGAESGVANVSRAVAIVGGGAVLSGTLCAVTNVSRVGVSHVQRNTGFVKNPYYVPSFRVLRS